MKTRYTSIFFSMAIAICFMTICSCGPYVSTSVQLSRDRYVSKIDPAPFAALKGKRVLLSSIDDVSANTKNLTYFNPERTVGYDLYYSKEHTMPQPVVSFFWYALQKAFETAGLKIEEAGTNYDAELSLTITSLTDEEIRLDALLKWQKTTSDTSQYKGLMSYKKSHVVTVPKVQTHQPAMLEQRAYTMMDAIVTSILGDPDFQSALLAAHR